MAFSKNIWQVIISLGSCLIVAALTSYFFKFSLLIIFAAIISVAVTLVIFKNPTFGVYVLTALLPFERIGSFDIANITIRPSQIFALIIFLAYLLRFFTKKEDFAAKNPLLIPLFLFWGISIFSMINSPNLSRSVFVFFFNAFTMLLAIFLPNLIKKESELLKTTWILLGVTGFVSLFGIYQFFGDILGLPPTLTGLRELYTKSVFGFPRVQSTFLEPLYFANFLLIPISLSFSFLLSKLKKSFSATKILGLVFILFLATTNLLLTLSRGGYLALAFLLLFIFLIYFKSFFSLKKILILILAASLSVFAVYQFLKFTGKEKNLQIFLTQATTFSAKKSVAVKERETTAKTAWQMIKERPILGYGPGSFGPYAAASSHIIPKSGWAIVNNIFLEIWAEEGIFGLLSFLAIISLLIFRSLKSWQIANRTNQTYLKTILIGLVVAFLAIFVQYQTFSILYIFHIWYLIGLICACQNIILNQSQKAAKKNKDEQKI